MISSFLRSGAPASRRVLLLPTLLAGCLGTMVLASAAQAQQQRGRPAAAAAAPAAAGQGQAMLLETAGKWQAFSSQQGRSKVCYALSKAESRLPANLKERARPRACATRSAS